MSEDATPRMSRAHRLYLATSAAGIAFIAAYIWPALAPVRVYWYYPLERRWDFVERPDGLAIDWYGRLLVSLIAGLVFFAVTDLVARRLRPPPRRALELFAAWLVTAALLAMLLYAYQLSVRNPVPEPLPDWYQAR